jgi:uncharacterized membrane protein
VVRWCFQCFNFDARFRADEQLPILNKKKWIKGPLEIKNLMLLMLCAVGVLLGRLSTRTNRDVNVWRGVEAERLCDRLEI